MQPLPVSFWFSRFALDPWMAKEFVGALTKALAKALAKAWAKALAIGQGLGQCPGQKTLKLAFLASSVAPLDPLSSPKLYRYPIGAFSKPFSSHS